MQRGRGHEDPNQGWEPAVREGFQEAVTLTCWLREQAERMVT